MLRPNCTSPSISGRARLAACSRSTKRTPRRVTASSSTWRRSWATSALGLGGGSLRNGCYRRFCGCHSVKEKWRLFRLSTYPPALPHDDATFSFCSRPRDANPLPVGGVSLRTWSRQSTNAIQPFQRARSFAPTSKRALPASALLSSTGVVGSCSVMRSKRSNRVSGIKRVRGAIT